MLEYMPMYLYIPISLYLLICLYLWICLCLYILFFSLLPCHWSQVLVALNKNNLTQSYILADFWGRSMDRNTQMIAHFFSLAFDSTLKKFKCHLMPSFYVTVLCWCSCMFFINNVWWFLSFHLCNCFSYLLHRDRDCFRGRKAGCMVITFKHPTTIKCRFYCLHFTNK